jgi:hypothetical protein
MGENKTIIEQVKDIFKKIEESKNVDLRPYFQRKDGRGEKIYGDEIDKLKNVDLSEYVLITPTEDDKKVDILKEIGVIIKEGKKTVKIEYFEVLFKLTIEASKKVNYSSKLRVFDETGYKLEKIQKTIFDEEKAE